MNSRIARALSASALAGLTLAAAPAAHGANLIVNGSFETPLVSTASQFASIPGWTRTCGTSIEIQGPAIGWTAADGLQWWESDGVDNTCLAQTLTTTPGAGYTLSFAHSARPGVLDNGVEVYWDGQLVVTLNANGVGQTNTAWQLGVHTVVASGASTVVEFKAIGPQNALGGLIDNVKVEPLRCHAPCIGDANGDGVVNFADVTAVLANFNTTCP